MIWNWFRQRYTGFMSSLEDALLQADGIEPEKKQLINDLTKSIAQLIDDADVLIALLKHLREIGEKEQADELYKLLQGQLNNVGNLQEIRNRLQGLR